MSEQHVQHDGVQDIQSYWETVTAPRLAFYDDYTASGMRSPSTTANMYRCIDADFTALQRAVTSLRTRRNGLAPISRLPPEILIRIFCLASQLTYQRDGTLLVPHRARMDLSHTCRHWRRVALAFPDLWQDVDLSDVRYAENILAHVPSAPVTLVACVSPLEKSTCDLVLNHISHAKELYVIEHRKNVKNASWRDGRAQRLCAGLTMPAPLLEHLTLKIKADERIVQLRREAEDLFGGCAPRLQSVDVRNVGSFPWLSPTFANLVKFSFGFSMNTSIRFTPPPIADVLRHLQRMASLEELALSWCLHGSDASLVPPAIDLPRLRTLSIDGDLMECTLILTCLRFPSSITLSIRAVGIEDDRAQAHIGSLLEATSTGLDLGCTGVCKASFDSRFERRSHRLIAIVHRSEDRRAALPPGQLSLDVLVLQNTSPNLLDVFLRHLIVITPGICDTLLHLNVDTDAVWTVDNWSAVLRPARHLRRLGVCRGASQGVCSALAPPTGMDATVALCCPELSTLEFSSVPPDLDTLEDLVIECLRTRSSQGCTPLQSVSISGHCLSRTRSTERAIRHLVVSLSVNGSSVLNAGKEEYRDITRTIGSELPFADAEYGEEDGYLSDE